MKIGISGYEKTLDGKVDFFELDFQENHFSFVQSSEIMVTLNQFFYRNSISLSEKIDLIKSRVPISKVIGFSIRLIPSFFEKQKLEDQVFPLLEEIKSEFSTPAWIDLNQNVPNQLKIDQRFSTDPLWKQPVQGGLWKIHGWHEARWVRRYSTKDLLRLKKLAHQYEPSFVTFAHSQRATQVDEFLKLNVRILQ
jgi:hypothetical protein